MSEVPRRRRDPEARRRELVDAAAALIVEVGADAITHRMVAARAGAPLGATTQYFATLDDLRTAALRHLADGLDARIASVRHALEQRGTSPAALTDLISQALTDAGAVQADRAVVTAAVFDPTLRELARNLSQQLIGFLAPSYGIERATAAAVFIDGVMWNAHISDDSLDRHLIETALTGILGDPAGTASAETASAETASA